MSLLLDNPVRRVTVDKIEFALYALRVRDQSSITDRIRAKMIRVASEASVGMEEPRRIEIVRAATAEAAVLRSLDDAWIAHVGSDVPIMQYVIELASRGVMRPEQSKSISDDEVDVIAQEIITESLRAYTERRRKSHPTTGGDPHPSTPAGN